MSGWSALQQAALMDAHPAWFPGVEAELVRVARMTPAGRRALSGRVAERFELLESPPAAEGDDTLVREREWILTPLVVDSQVMFRVGALRSLPWLRRQVQRGRVLALQRHLGAALYRDVLRMRCDWTLSADDEASLDRVFDESGAETPDVAELTRTLERWGCSELLAYGQGLHRLIGERMSIAVGGPDRASETGVLAGETVDAFIGREASEERT